MEQRLNLRTIVFIGLIYFSYLFVLIEEIDFTRNEKILFVIIYNAIYVIIYIDLFYQMEYDKSSFYINQFLFSYGVSMLITFVITTDHSSLLLYFLLISNLWTFNNLTKLKMKK